MTGPPKKTVLRKITSIIVLIVVVCVAVLFYSGHTLVWQYDHLEQNASKVITSAELQTWAANLLDSYPPTNTWLILCSIRIGH